MAQDGCCFQLGQLAAKLSSAVPGPLCSRRMRSLCRALALAMAVRERLLVSANVFSCAIAIKDMRVPFMVVFIWLQGFGVRFAKTA